MTKEIPPYVAEPGKESAEDVDYSTATVPSMGHSGCGAGDELKFAGASFHFVPTGRTPTRDVMGPHRPRASYVLQPECDVDGSVDIGSLNPVEPPPSSRGLVSCDNVSHASPPQLNATNCLSTQISEDILRGVSIKIVLEGFAEVFQESPIVEDSRMDFKKSVPVKRLDDFISHDWASTRAGKLATLILVYNSRAALITSMCVGLLFLALQSTSLIGVLPYPKTEVIDDTVGGWGFWCLFVCPIAFVYVLIHWQTLRDRLGLSAKQVFLDKCCVDQIDELRKAEGILGLAGFLNKTDRLVICWTPRYFTRVWCVYEIASWLYLRKPLDRIVFMPLALAKAIFAFHCISVLGIVAFAIGQHVSSLSTVVSCLVIFVFGPWYIQSCRHFVHDMRNLPGQLQDFAIATAQCYCCAVGHKVPDTGKELQCDRQLVCRTVNGWFGDGHAEMPCSSCESSYVEGVVATVSSATNFDERVRGLFGPWILQRAGPTQIPYNYSIIAGIPFIWRLLDVMVCFGSWDVSLHFKMAKVLEYFVGAFCFVPCLKKASLRYCCFLDEAVGIRRNLVLDWLLSAVFFLPPGCVCTGFLATLSFALDMRYWKIFYCMCGFLVVIAAALFLPEGAVFCWRRGGRHRRPVA